MINHGTRGGYYAHRRLKITPCDACREAINEYVQDYRARTGRDRDRTKDKIRRKALAILRDIHRLEYEEIVFELSLENKKNIDRSE